MTQNNPLPSSNRALKQHQQQNIEQQKKEEIAYRLYEHRTRLRKEVTKEDDWKEAENIFHNPLRRALFWLNTPFVVVEKRFIEPSDQWLNRLEIFRIFEKLSPVLQAIGVLLIPFILTNAARDYQDTLEKREEERLQDVKIFQYLNQLSTILLQLDNTQLQTDESAEIRALARATTLTLLGDENFGGSKKGKVIGFLNEMNLIQGESDNPETDEIDESVPPILSLAGADLRNADLRNVDLSNTDLSDADLRGANLRNANLRNANLHNADFSNTNLRNANLRNADLRNANFSNAILLAPDFRNSKDLTANQFSKDNHSYLCNAALPETITTIDPDRDCDDIPQEMANRYQELSLEQAKQIVDESIAKTWD